LPKNKEATLLKSQPPVFGLSLTGGEGFVKMKFRIEPEIFEKWRSKNGKSNV